MNSEQDIIRDLLESERKAFRIVAESAIHASDLHDLCKRILEGLVDVLGFSFGTIRLYDSASNRLTIFAHVGMTIEELGKLVSGDLDDPRPVFTLVGRSKEPIFAPDVGSSNLESQYRERLNALDVQALIMWPILDARKNLLGVISIASHEPRELPEWDRSFFEIVAELFAVAMQRKITEDQLKENERKYRSLFDQNNDAVFIHDVNGYYIAVNKQGMDLLGYSEDELLKMTFRDTVIEEEIAESEKQIQDMLEGKTLPIYERTVRKKDGSEISVEINVALVRDEEGNPLHIQSIMRDITKWKSDLQTLRRLSMAVTHNPTSVVITDLNGSIEYVNPKFSELTGYSLEEAIGKNPSILKSGETAIETYDELWNTITAGEVWHGEFTNRKKNGDIYYEEAWIAPITDSDSKITSFVAVKEDITQQRNVRKALEFSEKRHRDLIEKIQEGIGIVDFDENIIFANQALADILQWPIDELTQMNLKDMLSTKELGKVREETSKRMEGESSAYELEMQRKDGEVITLRISSVPWQNELEENAGAIAVVTDITEQKKAERALMESEERLDLALKGADLGVWDWDAENDRFIYDKRYAEILEYTVDELGTDYEAYESRLHPDDIAQMEEKWGAHLRGEIPMFSSEHRLRTKSGSYKWVLERGKVQEWLQKGRTKRATGTILDVNERVLVERRLRRSNRDLELYASILRHDLGNDLQIILSQSEMGSMLFTPGSQEMTCCEVTKSAAERMSELLEILGRPDTKEYSEIQDLLEQTAAQAERTHAGLKISIFVDTKARRMKTAGGRLLNALFTNLFRNGAQHAGPETKIRVTLTKRGKQAQIDVIDNGPGVRPELRDKLFTRGVSTTGRGQGLYLCRLIVKAYGGSIEYLDNDDEGATFRIMLPLH
ncbi:MAG: PAS domain S-box protein [Candidatus Hodarchaeota archaeon]